MLPVWALPVRLSAWLGAAFGLLGAAAQAAQPAEVRLAPAADGARVEIALPQTGAPKVFALPPPRPRVAVDLPQTAVRIDGRIAATGEGLGLGPVERVRFAQRENGVTRIVLDLAPGAALAGRRVVAEGGSARLELQIAQGDAAEPAAAPSSAAPRGRARPRVVIDAGHGGRDPGAIGAGGAQEKDVTLAAALLLREELRARGVDVLLTRETDKFLTLFERVGVARDARADLFISLHADANADPNVRGASVYTLSEGGGARARSTAQTQNWELDLPATPRSRTAGAILMDLAQRRTRSRSEAFADLLIAELEQSTPLLRNTHRRAGFAVLLAPDVPAALVELGFMTNPADEARLTDPAQARAMMRDAADAIEAFLAPPVAFAQS